jgi:Uma2 family endonuclease
MMVAVMSTLAVPTVRPSASEIPPLEAGDHLDRHTFHERYEAMPSNVKAELIGGTVYLPSPAKPRHGEFHVDLSCWLGLYLDATPGLRAMDNTTDKLGDDSEPQPDLMLIVEGGQTKTDDTGYIVGPPEFVVEVASSSVSYDLHSKKMDYERHGVGEYVVLVVRDYWAVLYVREAHRFVELPAGADGVLRSRLFPGLWLDAAALFRNDRKRFREVSEQGLQSPEHAAFVAARAKP